MKIALLGATGHVAKNIHEQLKNKHEFYEFSREPIENYDRRSLKDPWWFRYPYKDFNGYEYDAIINCVGYGNPASIEEATSELLEVTEEYDKFCLNYLKIHSNTTYIYLSSGVASNKLDLSNIYQLSKIYTETKHRILPKYNIIDIRLYAFFSRYSSINDSFFMSQILKSVVDKTDFLTDESIVWRDYINPKDLVQLIELSLEKPSNTFYETYSLKPIEKFDILEYFKKEYNLQVKIIEKYNIFSSAKTPLYYSRNKNASNIGYKPNYSSFDTIKQESKVLLNGILKKL